MYDRVPRRLRLEINPGDKSWIEECRKDSELANALREQALALIEVVQRQCLQSQVDQAMDEASDALCGKRNDLNGEPQR